MEKTLLDYFNEIKELHHFLVRLKPGISAEMYRNEMRPLVYAAMDYMGCSKNSFFYNAVESSAIMGNNLTRFIPFLKKGDLDRLNKYYLKHSYLYGIYKFFIYEPFLFKEVLKIYKDKHGKITEIHGIDFNSNCFQYKVNTVNKELEIVLDFKPDLKNILNSEFPTFYLLCKDNRTEIIHTDCDVIPHKYDNSTQVRCRRCGIIGKVSKNGFTILETLPFYYKRCDTISNI